MIPILLAVWTAAWIAMGVAVASEVKGLAGLSDTVTTVGGAVQASGTALGALSGLPVVGARVADPAQRIEAAGESALSSGRASRNSIEDLSTLLGLVVALVPTLPLLGVYVALRVSDARERRALVNLLRTHKGDPRLPRLLAQRALGTLSYEELAAAALDGGGDGSTERLASAELARLGVDGSDRGGGV